MAASGKIQRPYHINNDYLDFGDWNQSIENVLSSKWRTAVPNDELPYFVSIAAAYGRYWGMINRYDDKYGTFLGVRYDGTVLFSRMNNGSIAHKYL